MVGVPVGPQQIYCPIPAHSRPKTKPKRQGLYFCRSQAPSPGAINCAWLPPPHHPQHPPHHLSPLFSMAISYGRPKIECNCLVSDFLAPNSLPCLVLSNELSHHHHYIIHSTPTHFPPLQMAISHADPKLSGATWVQGFWPQTPHPALHYWKGHHHQHIIHSTPTYPPNRSQWQFHVTNPKSSVAAWFQDFWPQTPCPALCYRTDHPTTTNTSSATSPLLPMEINHGRPEIDRSSLVLGF